MKKIRIHKSINEQINNIEKNIILNEARRQNNNQQVQQQQQQNNGPLTIFDPDSDITKIMEKCLNDVKLKDNCLVHIKLNANYLDSIQFPNAAMTLTSLLQSTQFPKKFENIHNELDNKPLDTISHQADEALNCFANVKFDIYSHNPQSQNESYSYNYNNTLNEDLILPSLSGLATAAGVGATVGTAISTGMTYATAAGATAAAPIALTGAGISKGAEAVSTLFLGPDHGNYKEDDKELRGEKYDMPKPENPLKTESAEEAIDTYLTRINNYVTALLKKMVASTAKNDIAKLQVIITNIISNAGKSVEAYINDNRDEVKRKKELDDQAKLNDAREAKSIEAARTQALLQAIKIKNFDLIEKIQKSKSELELNKFTKQMTSEGVILAYNKNRVLNEEDAYTEETEINIPAFDANKIYEGAKATIQEKIIEILSTDEMEWPDIKWARKQMETMRDEADKEIKQRIDIICRTGSNNNLGATSKIASFIQKHPLRAEGLKNLWQRHMRDLDQRMERRLKTICEPDGRSPMDMCLTFLKDTYPKIVAIMITYKSIIKIITDERLKDAYPDGSTVLKRNSEENANELNRIATTIEAIFDSYGSYINSKNQKIYDLDTHNFINTNEGIDMLGLFISNISSPLTNPDMYRGGYVTYESIIKNLHDNYTNNKPTEFFQQFTFLLNVLHKPNLLYKTNLIKPLEEMQNSVNYFNGLQKIKETILKIFVPENLDNIKYVISRVIATKGEVLNNYEKNKEDIRNINKDTSAKDIEDIKTKLGLNAPNKETEIEAITSILDNKLTDATITDISNMLNTDIYVGLLDIYFKCMLNECTSVKTDGDSLATLYRLLDLLSSNINIALGNDVAVNALIHMKDVLINVASSTDDKTSAAVIYDYLHSFNKDNKTTGKSDKINLEEYWEDFNKTVLENKKLSLPALQGNDILASNNINSIKDLGAKAGAQHAETLKDVINQFDNISDKKNAGILLQIMQQIIPAYVSSYDQGYEKADMSAFDSLFTIDNNKGILVGYDSNKKAKYITFTDFCTQYQKVYDILNNSTNAGSSAASKFSDISIKLNNQLSSIINTATGGNTTLNMLGDTNSDFYKFGKNGQTDKETVKKELTNKYFNNITVDQKAKAFNAIKDFFISNLARQFMCSFYGNANGPVYTVNQN